jgi:hypothetical protein
LNLVITRTDVNEYYSLGHLEWNLLLFVGVGVENDIVAYSMDSRKVHIIHTHYNKFLKRGILLKINGRPYYPPYVPLFSNLESLAEE